MQMWGSGPFRLVPGAGAARWPSLITATMARCIRRDAKAAGPIVVHDHRLSPVDRRRAAVIVDQGPGSGSVLPDGRSRQKLVEGRSCAVRGELGGRRVIKK